MEQKNNIAILILGDADADKTTIQRIIGQALQDAGVHYTLGADSQRENNLLGSSQYDQETAALQLNNTTTVVMEQVEADAINSFVRRSHGPLIGYGGYEHSSGLKIIPVYEGLWYEKES